ARRRQSSTPDGQSTGVPVFAPLRRRIDEIAAEILDLDFALRVLREVEKTRLVENDHGKPPSETAADPIPDRPRVL
ncbi:MAG: hypothetical protein NDJ92_14645, partial [Thermoanaerobaculia bacterium]|nr:hypothetical protein [Thermoanaerobaculia bacterium]